MGRKREAIGTDLSGRAVEDLLAEAARYFDRAGGGPFADCLGDIGLRIKAAKENQ